MRVITAPEKYIRKPDDVTVFLAGGITNCWEWQDKVIELLSETKYINFNNLVIFNPRRKDFPIDDPNAAEEQIAWEFEMLEQCDIFSMYFCAGESDQPICMYELGRNICRMQTRFPINWDMRIIVTVEKGYKRKKDVYVQTSLATIGNTDSECCNKNIEEHVNEIIGDYCYIDDFLLSK